MSEGSLRNQILLLWSDPKERQAIFKILRATGADVEFGVVDSAAGFPTNEAPYQLVVLDYDSMRPDAQRLLGTLANVQPSPPVLVVTSSRDKHDLIELLGHSALTNLLAKNVELRANELVVTVKKIITGNIFGLEKYLCWGIEPIECVIKSSEQKAEVGEALRDYLYSIGVNKRLARLAQTVSDEFLMNAIYDAPIDKRGATKYASRSRSQPVQLSESEEVRFRYACDGNILAVSVQDNFGRLDPDTVRSYLRKCFVKGADQIDAKDGGAGLGLYYAFESLNHLIANVEYGAQTEMIGLMAVSGSYREFAGRAKSLSIFVNDGRAK